MSRSAVNRGFRTCPTPDKHPYASERAAKQGIKTIRRTGADGGPGRLHAYCCPARSHWHIGHTTY